MYNANSNHNREGGSYTNIKKYILKEKNVTRSKKGHFMMITGTIYQEDITISIYAHNNRAQTTWSKNWLTGEIDNST